LSVAPRRDVEGEIYERLYGAGSEAPFEPSGQLGAPEELESFAGEEAPPGTHPPLRLAILAFAARLGLGGGRARGPRSAPPLRRRRTFAQVRHRKGLVLTVVGVVLGFATIVGALAPDPAVEGPPEDASDPESRATVADAQPSRAKPDRAKADRTKAAERRRARKRRDARAARRERSVEPSGAAVATASGAREAAPQQVCFDAGGCFVATPRHAPSSRAVPESSGDLVIEVPRESDGDDDAGSSPGGVGGGFDPGEVDVESIDP
jgi:hypothetical protein